MAKKILSTVLGARASTAGDIYHELWALRYALRLLVAKTELKAVTVEGIAAPENSDYQWDGVDCALFYGASSLGSASKIELLQLKYSTTDPLTAWTVARFVYNKSKNGNNSVLRKLADTFKNAHEKIAEGAMLSIKLVSNQPIANEVNDVIAKIRSDEKGNETVSKFITATGLKKSEIPAFLDALDFSEMGGESRSALQDALTKEASEIIADQADDTVSKLRTYIRDLMAPGAEREIIEQGKVISWFGHSSIKSLFPAPPDLQLIPDPIKRSVTGEIVGAIKNGSRLICVHGLGGCGKTTTMLQINSQLPKGSIVTFFDCYGGGRYKYSNDERHLPAYAFLQIINDLAVAQGLPFLVPTSINKPVSIRIFLEKVRQSAELLQKIYPDSILAILIDAADNSVSVAEAGIHASECFIWEISESDLNSLPSNVRIVFSCRSGRKDFLRLPPSTPMILCPPFTREETKAYAKKKLPDVSEEWVDQFQMLSSGIPRVQSAAFATGGTSKHDILEALRPNGKKLDTVLRELFQNAALKVHDKDFYTRCASTIGILPAPIPLLHLAAICCTTVENLKDFIADVQPTLRIENDTAVTIADEDVEDFLNEEGRTRLDQTLREVCAYFEPIFLTDEYAAIYYVDLLNRAGRSAEILPIIEHDLAPKGISDPITRREVQLRRLRLALNACRKTLNSADTLKVTLLSAEAAKDEDVLIELIEREAELSIRFASGSLFRLVLSDKDQYPKQGGILVHEACKAALNGDMVTAREQLSAYDNWDQQRRNVPEHEHHEWKLSEEDIVTYAEARTHIQGPKDFIPCFREWYPRWQAKTALQLVPQLIKHNRIGLVEKSYLDNLVGRPWNLFLTVPLALSGYPIKTEILERDLKALRRLNVPNLRNSLGYGDDIWKLEYLEMLVTACEIAFTKDVNVEAVRNVLCLILDPRRSPSDPIYSHNTLQVDVALRAWLLQQTLNEKNLKSEDFLCLFQNEKLPTSKSTGSKKKYRNEKSYQPDDKAKRIVDAIFPIYESRIALLEEASKGKINGIPKSDIADFSRDTYYFDRDYQGSQFRIRSGQSIARLMHIEGLSIEYIFECSKTVIGEKSNNAFANRSLPIWKDFLVRPALHEKILTDIVACVGELRAVRTGSRTKSDTLLKFSKIVLHFSPEDAKVLFEEAVEINKEIDREAMAQIEFMSSLVSQSNNLSVTQKRSLATGHAAFVTDAAIRLEGEEYFPWEKAVSTLHDLSKEAALAAISQWQDEGIVNLDDTLPTWLENISLVEKDVLLSSILAGLLKYVPKDFFNRQVVLTNKIASRNDGSVSFDLLCKKVLLDTSPHIREELLDILIEHMPVEHSNSEAIRRLIAEKNIYNKKASEPSLSDTNVKIKFSDDSDFSTQEGIKAAIAYAKMNSKGSYVSLETVLNAVQKKITGPAQRVPYLNVLGDFEPFEIEARTTAILGALHDWEGQPAIEKWRVSVLPNVIKNNLLALLRWPRENSSNLSKLIKAANLHGKNLVDVLSQALEKNSADYSSGALFTISETIGSALEPEEVSEIIQWYSKRLGDSVPLDIKARFELTEIPETLNVALGRFLFALMSDIDVRIRWRAAHCLRTLTNINGSDTLMSVFAAYDRKSEDAFRLNSAPFYWLAARLWSTMTAARIALETPAAISTIASKLLAIVLDKELPHYLIKEHAKNALESALAIDKTILNEEQKIALRDVNRPKFNPIIGKPEYNRGLEWYEREAPRFKFNRMDTLPHWYDRLYRIFTQLTPDEFFFTLEKYIIDQWQADPEANWWDKEPRKSRISSNESLSSHHGHGALPTIERYGTYLEWHAMFCGLGEWLETKPLIATEDYTDRLEYWIEGWKPTEAPAWLADRRTYRPFDSEFLIDKSGDDQHWFRRIPKQKFIAVVCGAQNSNPNELTVFGDWKVSDITREVDVDIRSALVEPCAAIALLKAISGDEKRFWLPTEREEYEDEDFDKSPFKLYAWLARIDGDMQFDKNDPLRQSVDRLSVKPAESLEKKYKLRAEGLPVSRWCSNQDDWFQYEAWGDWNDRENEKRRPRRQVGSIGYRLKINKEALQTILMNENLDLITDITITRRLEDEYGEATRWDNKKGCKTRRKILIFRKGGEIEDNSGRVRTWL